MEPEMFSGENLEGIGELLKHVPKLFEYLKNPIKILESKDEKVKLEKARESVYEALRKTQRYISERKEGGVNRGAERDLYEYWDQASRALKGVDNELSDLCGMKGRWWLEDALNRDVSSSDFDKIRLDSSAKNSLIEKGIDNL